ncbi:hypothetical protein GCM10023085_23710 [Actinomadura viridis]
MTVAHQVAGDDLGDGGIVVHHEDPPGLLRRVHHGAPSGSRGSGAVAGCTAGMLLFPGGSSAVATVTRAAYDNRTRPSPGGGASR